MGSAVLTATDANWAWTNVTNDGSDRLWAEAIGGGGAGGHGAANPANCGGGKAGSYAKVEIVKGTETTLNITVGAGGTTAAGSAVDGTASTIVQGSTTVLSAAGGATVANNSATGATALVGANTGTTIHPGGNGGDSTGTGTPTSSGSGGGSGGPTGDGSPGTGATNGGGAKGSGTFLNGTIYSGNGGNGVAVRNAGNPGQDAPYYGAAGSGGNTNQVSDKTGGAGRPGVVVLTWVTYKEGAGGASGTATVAAVGAGIWALFPHWFAKLRTGHRRRRLFNQSSLN